MKKMLKLTELSKREMGRIMGGRLNSGSCSTCNTYCMAGENKEDVSGANQLNVFRSPSRQY